MADSATGSNGIAPEQRIIQALAAVHDPRTSNALRQEASQLLRSAEDSPEAIQIGFSLASDRSHDAAVRHFGLSTLEHVVRHNWENFPEEAQATVKPLILRLAEGLSENDPIYIRNKVASLWTVLAERTWAISWMDMDENLVQLWNATNHHKSTCLTILDSLAEDVFVRDDATALLRTSSLNRECLQIFTPKAISDKNLSTKLDANLRYGEEGWLTRITAVLLNYGGQALPSNGQTRALATECLRLLRTIIPYSVSEALAEAHVVPALLHCLQDADPKLSMVSVSIVWENPQVLTFTQATMDAFATLTGPRMEDRNILRQIVPVYDQNVLFQQVFTRNEVDVNDIDFEKYSVLKRTTEVCRLYELVRDIWLTST